MRNVRNTSTMGCGALASLLVSSACGTPPKATSPSSPASAQSVTSPGELAAAAGQPAASPYGQATLPRIVSERGRHALLVDGEPYLMLCAQANNSSNSEASLAEVWAAVEALNANTLQIPVAWEQVEVSEGQFDFSFVDTLLAEARERDVRLAPLWFGAFKNTSPSYAPPWVKLDNDRFPRMVRPDGDNHYALSPLSRELFEAEKRAFSAFMQHLRSVDPQHTVILVQVDNEVGVYGLVRDFSKMAAERFDAAVPVEVAAVGGRSGSWEEVFGSNADEYFMAHAFASYVGGLAEAGRAVLDVPMYTNAALRHPTAPQKPGQYASGGPTHNVLDIWKASAPALAMLTPDIYLSKSEDYFAVLAQYQRPDNALFVSETGRRASYPRYFFEVLGRGGIGFAPFGVDRAPYVSHPDGVKGVHADALDDFASNYALIAGAARQWAQLAFENGIYGAARADDNAPRVLDLGRWRGTVSFDEWPFGYRKWFPPDAEGLKDPSDFHNAGVLVARLSDSSFLVTGHNARIEFAVDPKEQPGQTALIVSADEVVFEQGNWVTRRRWNGDQTDYGLNFTELNQTVRVELGAYPSRNDSRSQPQAF